MQNVRLKEKYNELLPTLKETISVPNTMAAPKIKSIVLNMGLGDIKDDEKLLNEAMADLTTIAGQKAVATVAKKAISGFKLREGAVVGAKVTLRGAKMYEFLDRLISIALPRTRDFRGLPNNSFAGGSYSMGIKEHTIFPEIAGKGRNPLPFQVTINTTTSDKNKAKQLLVLLGMPFKKEDK